MLSNFSFHHIGYATDSIEKTSKFFIELGYSVTHSIFDDLQNVNIAFLSKIGSPIIELVELVNEQSPVLTIITKNGVSPYHISYEVEEIDHTIDELIKLKLVLLYKPVPAIALNGRMICYLFNKNVGLIELLNR